jgi:hypothetical protein
MTHTINVPLAQKVLAQILAAPERWTQSCWLNRPYEPAQQSPFDTVDNCATSGCFAGWTAVLDGYKTDAYGSLIDVPASLPAKIREAYDYREGDEDDGDDMDTSYYADYPRVQHAATVSLGLNPEQAGLLFESTNTLRDLYDYLAEWTEGEIVVPDNLPVWADMEEYEKEEHFEARRFVDAG